VVEVLIEEMFRVGLKPAEFDRADIVRDVR
jgi:hypothetical protein